VSRGQTSSCLDIVANLLNRCNFDQYVFLPPDLYKKGQLLRIVADATHLVITEAKIFSKLSVGAKNASYFNQAGRYTSCIVELLNRANWDSAKLKRIGLYVLTAEETIGYVWFER
jgi:hypothetical protein